MEKVTDEIKNVVQKVLDDEERFSGWYIEKELERFGIKVSRMTISNLRNKKTTLGNTKFETLEGLYFFAKTHENITKE
ncbi:hypothetical protein [Lactococcus taiwanensis]|uniref:hypothetical protein n=1 Tax=Lactococcus taiwanensis TaxID=1151742 RepID=UPI003519C2B3